MGQARDRGTALSRSAVRVAAGVGFSARSVRLRRHRSVEYSQIQITWFQQDEQQWAVGRGLDRLEQATPTLGATALHLLDEHSRYVYPVFTPRTAQDVASMMYWYGEEDETFALEEACADDEEARAAMREEMVTKASMTEAFPAWALAWQSRNARRIGVGADRRARQR